MEQSGHQIFDFFSRYGYWFMLPLMTIEGPVATIIAATLAALGAFNVLVVLIFSIAGDILGDIILYGLGYKYGLGFVRRVGKYVGITENLVARMEKYFKRHGGKTIFVVKSTTGLCWATFTAAGIAKMPFGKFLLYSFLGGVVWSGFLVIMGYFFGYLWREIAQYISWIGWIVTGFIIVFYATIMLYKNWKTGRLLTKNGDSEF